MDHGCSINGAENSLPVPSFDQCCVVQLCVIAMYMIAMLHKVFQDVHHVCV